MRNVEYLGPSMPISEEIDTMKYRLEGETFNEKIKRIARALCDGTEHQWELEDILGHMRFLVIEKICIEAALEITNNNRAAAADLLGLSRQSLYVKLSKFEI